MRHGFAKATTLALLLVIVIAQGTLVVAQRGPQGVGLGSQARDLNNQLLTALTRISNLPNGETPAAIRSQADSVIGQRAAVLEALIAESPKEALSLAFSADLLSRLSVAFPDSAKELEANGEWEGPIEVLVEDGVNLLSHKTVYRMRMRDGQTANIHFPDGENESLGSGDVLRVRGVRVKSEIAAADGGIITGTSVAGAPMCSTLGAQRSIVLMVNMPGTTPPAISTTGVRDIFFGTTGRSVSEFWRESSYGQAWAEGDVRGWYTLDATYSCDQYPLIRDAAVRAADRDVDFSQYSRVFVIISGMTGNCGWAGVANVGCGSTINTAEGTFTVSTAWLLSQYFSNRDEGVILSTHEGGHGLGLSHSASRDFGAEILGAPGITGTLDEYGDDFSTMGYWNLGQYNAPHKVKLGWMTNYVSVATNGSFAIQPIESLGGIQALKIQRGTDTTKFLWLEYRQPLGGYDNSLRNQVFSGALVHYQDATTGNKTHLLDFTPETLSFSDPALTSFWKDSYTNLSIAVTGATTSSLNVDVNFGSVPCVTSSPTISLSPLNPSVSEGGSVNYTVTIKNNDTSSCSPRSFSMTSLVPGTWPTTFAQNTVTVSPASQSATSMTKTVPVGTTAATYSVDAVASSVANSVSATANVTVMPTPPPPPPPPPTAPLSITVNAPPTPSRNTETISAFVSQGSGVSGATVVFTVVSPSGISTKRATTDTSGEASWNLKLNPKAPRGSYMVSAQATFGSQTVTSTTATFTVQ
jgi:M6 family metalloprotease-like protein